MEQTPNLHYALKDITTVKRGIIAHGVNCRGVMGAGVAGAIARTWPRVKREYLKGPWPLGEIQVVEVTPNTLYVANCFTQVDYGRDRTKRYANPRAIHQALDRVFGLADARHLPLVMPRIGTGLGGLDWTLDVKPLIISLCLAYPSVDTTVCSL